MKPKDAGSVARPVVAPLLTAAAGVILLICLTPALAAQEGPTGSDIVVGPGQFAQCPAVAMSADGDFEVVWNHRGSASLGISQGVFGRHFDRQGRPMQTSEMRLDSPDNEEAYGVRVVALPDGGYFVAWLEIRIRNGRSGKSIVGRFLSSAGRPRGAVLRLARGGYRVALAAVDDSVLVVWEETGWERNFRVRRLDFDGNAQGEPFLLIKQPGTGIELAPLSDSFVATWQAWTGSDWTIVAQRFSLTGEPLSPVLRVSQRPGGYGPRVASDGNDRFGVAWTTTRVVGVDPQTGYEFFDHETRARLFDAGGATGPETHPNQLPTGNQNAAGVAMNASGVILVTWGSDRHATTPASADVAGRFLDPAGQLASKAFPLMQNARGVDFCPAAAASGGAEWVVAWLKQEKSILARRLAFEN